MAMMMAPPDEVSVVIVGAGISGLSAARELTRRGFNDFAVVEASDRVGGRTLADDDGTDLGGAYIGPTQYRILAIIKEMGLDLQKVNLTGQSVQIINGKVSHYYGTIPPVSILGVFDLNAATVRLDDLCRTIDLEAPYQSPGATYWDTITAEELINQNTWTSDARKILRTAIRAILCVEPCTLSALYLLWYIAQSGGVKRIFETEGGAQDSKVVGGAGRISELLSERYAPIGKKLFLNTPIRRISTGDGGRVTLESLEGCTICAQRVILAIPPVQMLRMEFYPPLPAKRYLSLQRWPMGCICKTFMYYKTRFWTEHGLNGTIVADSGIVCVSYDDTKPDGSNPCIMGFVLADESLKYSSREERMKAISIRYAEAFKSDKALNYVAYKEKCWSDEPWVGGCYVGSCGPNVLTSTHLAHCMPIADKIFIAGTESARCMIGYMDGAVEAGERTARNVLEALKPSIYATNEVTECDIVASSTSILDEKMEISVLERILPSPRTIVISSVVIVAVLTGLVIKKFTSY